MALTATAAAADGPQEVADRLERLALVGGRAGFGRGERAVAEGQEGVEGRDLVALRDARGGGGGRSAVGC